MNKLSKSYKLSVYKQILAYIEATPVHSMEDAYANNRPFIGRINFCSVLIEIDCPYNIRSFPELYAKKPETGWPVNSTFWFHPYDRIRVSILKEIILEMETPWYIHILRFWKL